jgi:hypothetical protein
MLEDLWRARMRNGYFFWQVDCYELSASAIFAMSFHRFRFTLYARQLAFGLHALYRGANLAIRFRYASCVPRGLEQVQIEKYYGSFLLFKEKRG